uniref:Sodium/myo-inositol cotransporter n=1 Tax=Phallusia mammillata TaxID=59560 RepID=A0A6F9DTF9_9ASCI|nr:sodium/myo-inositol cotransporter [Phallusia mammillata]
MSGELLMGGQSLDVADLCVILTYFVIIIGIGIFASCVSKRNTVQGYFLAGRNMNWFLVGASLFVSNIGSEHFVGLAGSGAAGGIGVGAWELNALMLLQLLGWVFIPVYIASGICTMPEYLERRFGGKRLRVYLATLTLIIYCLTKISVNLYSGALFIQQAIGWPLYTSVTLLVCLTGLLTVTGGLTVVMYTDSMQALLMVSGALYLTIQGFLQIGGYYEMKEQYMQTTSNLTYIELQYNITINESDSCIPKPREDSFKMLKDVTDDEMPWLGFLLGQTPSSIWYWCTDQVIVQRALAAKSLSHAQGGTLLAGFIKILPIYIMVMPGMISRVLFTDDLVCIPGEHCMQLCGSAAGCTNLAYPRLVLGVMPSGARGLMMAVMIAALMSDLDSIFNSASTIFTLDLWKRFRKAASNTELMVVGRIFIVALIIISIAWVPIILQFQGGQLFFYIQEVTNYISPPIAAIFLTGILWKGCTEKGAFYGGLCGSALGLARLVTIFLYTPPICGEEDLRPAFLSKFHYMYYSAMLFFVTIIVAVAVSHFTKQPDKDLSRLTYWTRYDESPSMKQIELNPMNGDGKNGDVITNKETGKGDFENNPMLKKETVDEPTDEEMENEMSRWRSIGCGIFRFVCGIRKEGDTSDEPEVVFPTLYQRSREKVLLTAGLVVIMGAGIFLYIFWSV